MKAQKHECFHVNFPFSAYFYVPSHHNDKRSIGGFPNPTHLWRVHVSPIDLKFRCDLHVVLIRKRLSCKIELDSVFSF